MDKKIILLTNDDGIFGPGLGAMYRELTRLGEVYVVAPAVEQSGVSQSLTFRSSLGVGDAFVNGKRWGWTVNGSPADCVKVGVNVICPRKPDIVVSGINWGQNAGINVMYSGTLGAAFEGGMFGIPSFAVSVERKEETLWPRAGQVATHLIASILERISSEPATRDAVGNLSAQIYNINMPLRALASDNPEVVAAPMDTTPYGMKLQELQDTFGHNFYWLQPTPRDHRPDCLTDMNAMGLKKIVVTPLQIDRTNHATLDRMAGWNLNADVPPQEPLPEMPHIPDTVVTPKKAR